MHLRTLSSSNQQLAGCTIGTQIGVVSGVTVDEAGVGYTYANVTFSGGGGVGAAATAKPVGAGWLRVWSDDC